MELTQRIEIPMPPETVWDALNNPEILKQCLPGCESFDAVSDTHYEIVLQAKVGPVKAKFSGVVELSNINAPHSYTLSGSGKGGVAGFAKGGADISLAPSGDGTVMRYAVKAQVGGKLAQIGARLVDGAARKMAGDFFTKFVRVVCNDETLEITLETEEG